VLRSTQLDALRLDAELVAMLREQFSRVFAFFQPVRPDRAPLSGNGAPLLCASPLVTLAAVLDALGGASPNHAGAGAQFQRPAR
jgi:hypothetical protein